jgi:hypothetical protein
MPSSSFTELKLILAVIQTSIYNRAAGEKQVRRGSGRICSLASGKTLCSVFGKADDILILILKNS